MTKLKKNFRALPLAAICLLVLGGASALAQRQLRSALSGGRPELKVVLSGTIERGEKRLQIEKAESESERNPRLDHHFRERW